MKMFLDSAKTDEIRHAIELWDIDGVTTNPSMIARSGKPIVELVGEICDAVEGPVSAEVAATSAGVVGRLLGAPPMSSDSPTTRPP